MVVGLVVEAAAAQAVLMVTMIGHSLHSKLSQRTEPLHSRRLTHDTSQALRLKRIKTLYGIDNAMT